MTIEKKRYGILASGDVAAETKQYIKSGTTVVMEDDSRGVVLEGEEGLWVCFGILNELPEGVTMTDKAAYDAHMQTVLDYDYSQE